MNKEEVNKVLEELQQVDPSHLNDNALRLFNAIMSIADERDKYKHIVEEIKKYIAPKFVKQGGFTSYEWNDLLSEILKILESEE